MKKPLIKRISKIIVTFINKVLLGIIYIFGIGPTSIASKLVGKDFLKVVQGKSTWEKRSGSTDADKMF